MKKILGISLLLLLIVAGVVAWVFLGSGTGFSQQKETLYIPTGTSSEQQLIDSVQRKGIFSNTSAFRFLANRMGYWSNIRAGRYEIKKGTSLVNIMRMLRNGQQTPVNFVITKLRTKEDLARQAGAKFEFDSTAMSVLLQADDSLTKFGVTSEVAMSKVLPDTYTFLWNTTPEKIYARLAAESKKFWTPAREQQARVKGLTPLQVIIIASIVDEETNAAAERGNVASVYLNRVAVGMPLQADPTVKFALKDFGLKRIYSKHLSFESPYNTYRNKGLPPGPICTPSRKTIDAVLAAPITKYLYFVASPKFNGTHEFSETYTEHLQKARLYQQALNRQDSIRKNLL